MSFTIKENAHTVLLPAFASTELSDTVRRFLANGGCSILLGETREEYVAREMTLQRRQQETAEAIITVTGAASSLAGNTLVAVDQEIAGICRLHALLPSFPPREQIEEYSAAAFEKISATMALAAKSLGVNCFLGPVLDRVTGDNPWLVDRTWSRDAATIARISSAYIRGLQTNGIAAAAKHFPGYQRIALDPAIDSEARNTEPLASFEISCLPFADAITNGVEIIMTGPAIVEAFDANTAASTSPTVIGILREQQQFKGVVMSDDLDAKAILRGRPITQVAVEALNAGSDFLLIADMDDHVDQIASAITTAVHSGKLAESRLNDAAQKIRGLAAKYTH